MRPGSAVCAVFVSALLGGCAITGTIPEPASGNAIAGWQENTRRVAEETWLYAQLSSNAYDDEDAFLLPGDVVLRHMEPNDGRGYAYAIYDRFEGERLAETIIAFRGTEPSVADWVLGNILGLQNGRALLTARSVASELGGAALTVTGHSLGGALAHHVTLNDLHIEGIDAPGSRVFNNSPRFSGYARDGDRIAVVERGDWLTPLRFFGSEPNQLYTSLNCQPGYAPIRDHSIRTLAECLTWIAAYEKEEAQRALAANPLIGRPESQQSDDLPPGADREDRGIPLSPFVTDPAMARAIDASLQRSGNLSASYCPVSNEAPCHPTGLRLHVEGNPENGPVSTRWVISGIEQAKRDFDCDPENLSECTDAIVALGVDVISRPPVTRHNP